MEEKEVAELRIVIGDYNPEEDTYDIELELTIATNLNGKRISISAEKTIEANISNIVEAVTDTKKKMISTVEKILNDMVRLAEIFERIGAKIIDKAAINNYIDSVAEESGIIVYHSIAPHALDNECCVTPRELRERAERLLRLLQELRAREAF